ncbi:MAG: HEPN domain-containing protein [Egibacteraceae bacterium]
MSVPPDQPADEARRWLRFAEDDLLSAHTVLEHQDVAFRIAGFLAQQAAEKALKAVLAAHDLPVPRVHNLRVLAARLPVPTVELNPDDLDLLNPWITAGRYPETCGTQRATRPRSCAWLPSACSRW